VVPPKLKVMKKRKSWREKLERPQERKIIATPKGRMLIPKPTDINEVVKVIEKGKLVTDAQIREYLAKKYGADYTCPMTAGIFLRIVSEAAEEDLKKGVKEKAKYTYEVVSRFIKEFYSTDSSEKQEGKRKV